MFVCDMDLLVWVCKCQPGASVASHGSTMFLLNGCLSYPTDAEKGGSLVVGDFEIAAKYGEWCQGDRPRGYGNRTPMCL